MVQALVAVAAPAHDGRSFMRQPTVRVGEEQDRVPLGFVYLFNCA